MRRRQNPHARTGAQHDAEFDRFAHGYDELLRESIRPGGEEPAYYAAQKAGYVARALQAVRPPSSLLDFGCGIGGTLPHLGGHFPGAVLHGADVSVESLAIARAALPQVRFQAIVGMRLPYADASFDVAIAACVYHHIPPAERQHWASELRRVLRPGGTVFVFEHNPRNPLTRKVVRDCAFDADAILLPAAEARTLLDDAGFEGVHVDYTVFFPRALAGLRGLEHRLRGVPFGAQYAACGQAPTA